MKNIHQQVQIDQHVIQAILGGPNCSKYIYQTQSILLAGACFSQQANQPTGWLVQRQSGSQLTSSPIKLLATELDSLLILNQPGN